MFDEVADRLLPDVHSAGDVVRQMAGPIRALLEPVNRTAWLYLLTSVVVAALVFLVQRRRGEVEPGTSFRRFLFPPGQYTHRSARADYKLVLVDLTMRPLVYLPLVVTASVAAHGVTSRLPLPDLHTVPVLRWTVVAGAIAVLLGDFGNFFAHWLTHRSAVLWRFHEVHHSAEVLVPVTALREHPVDELVRSVVVGGLTGMFAGLYATGTEGGSLLPTVFGLNVVTFLFYALGYQLRHSHIWLSYGRLLNRVLISPAHHQVHHSVELAHRDRNFGVIFAFWDAIFGTLYAPDRRERFDVGLTGVDPEDFTSVRRLYLLPFVKVARDVQGRRRRPAQLASS